MIQTEFETTKTPLTEGKTKIIWGIDGNSTTLVIMKAKDATTADNDASKTRDIASKGACATKTTSRIFELLHEAGIPTAYVRQLSDTEILAKKCTMIPLEVIIRRYFDGSYLNRKPHLKRKGTPIRSHGLVFELFLKTSKGKLGDIDLRNYLPKDKEELIRYLNVEKTLKELQKKNPEIQNLKGLDYEVLLEEAIKIIDDPWIENPKDISQWALRHPKKPTWEIAPLTTINGVTIINDEARLKQIEEITRKVFLLLEGAWNTLGYRLVDFKIEFGLDDEGNLVVADVIDNDSWRLRTADWKEISKQTFRDNHPLKDVQENYVHVAAMVDQFIVPKQAIILWRGSDKDELPKCDVPSGIATEDVIISGHKEPLKACAKLEELHAKYPQGAVIIAIVGRSNGLGPMLSARTSWLVFSYCNSFKSCTEDVWSNLRMPSEVPNLTFIEEKNLPLIALNALATSNPVAYMARQFAIEKFDEQ